MKDSTRTVKRITAPVKTVTQRFAYPLLILSAIGVLVIGRVDVASMEQVRVQIVDAVAPILDVIGRPVASFNVGVDRIQEVYTVFDSSLFNGERLTSDRGQPDSITRRHGLH